MSVFDEYSADQLEAGVANALAARDFEAVRHIMLALATVDAHRANAVMQTILVGIDLAGETETVIEGEGP